MDAPQIARMRSTLLQWYGKHRRDLPWRHTKDPYAIWISEIMLQQTRVSAVAAHYRRFMKRFPTVVSLALAEQDEVLALWSGLGYYRRARLLHRAAQVVMSEHDGKIPKDIDTLRRMPGVGVYTSAAIASIAHGVPVAAVDGNVERVLARLQGEGEQRGAAKWNKLAQKLVDPRRPGDFNQAMMELGATVCTPQSPSCNSCPLYAYCKTHGEHPVPPRKQMRSVQVAYAVVTRGMERGREVLLQQRPADASIMPGMWELPLMTDLPEDEEPEIIVRHAITNTNYYVRVFRVDETRAADFFSATKGKWTLQDRLGDIPLTGLARKILRRMGHIKLEAERRLPLGREADVLVF
jgi:A/G-specific adenine glycosylase